MLCVELRMSAEKHASRSRSVARRKVPGISLFFSTGFLVECELAAEVLPSRQKNGRLSHSCRRFVYGMIGVNTGRISTEVVPFGEVKEFNWGVQTRHTASPDVWECNPCASAASMTDNGRPGRFVTARQGC